MNIAFDIARRIAFNRQRSFSRFIIRLSVAATAISVFSMLITLAFVNGFQQTVSQKVFSFWGNLRVQHTEADKSLVAEESPIDRNDTVENLLHANRFVSSVQVFATKSAVVQRKSDLEGMLLKGVDDRYDSLQLRRFMISGRWLQFGDSLYSKDILLSLPMARKLQVKLNDTVTVYFISQGGSTYRKLTIAGIYKTGIEEYDNLFAIGDIRLIRRVNGWRPNQIGGYEVFLYDYHKMDSVNAQLSVQLPVLWTGRTTREVYPDIFNWLNIQDVNRNVIFTVMTIVAVINLVTCLLILVLERSRMIGILKALGATDWMVQKIFLYQAAWITTVGVGSGFLLGTAFCLLQQYTGLIKLDETSYYVSVAPVLIIWWEAIAVCVGTCIVCCMALLLPSLIIRKTTPVQAIQFK